MVYCTVHQYTLTEHTSMYMYVIKFKYKKNKDKKKKSSQLNPNTDKQTLSSSSTISLICIIFLGSPYHYSSMSLTYTARKQLLNTITKYEIN